MDEINFAAKYKEWISIKKMDIDEKTAPPEVVHMLSKICPELKLPKPKGRFGNRKD